MLCDNCETELRKNWNFCPTCGVEVIREDIFISLGNILKKITNDIELEFSAETKRPFSYEVNSEPDEGHDEVYSNNADAPKRTVEPKISIKNLGNRMFFRINLPRVDPDNVRLTELDESFEIRARAGDRTYFKIVTVPQGFSLVEQYFEKGKLVLEFAA
ncbi:MAG: zinc ribbon domain-containing protein [Candidatus Aenigmarchaeota archaeon]|nr:zinc ribbon domain-containing protein [Candidatus Aenigmarchaeota archaeon]